MSNNINFDYKNLTPFKWFVLENFPFIEADFDALTEWQLFCKLGKEINKIIDSQNLVGEQAENLTNAFNNLKNYVDNYFDNLDVQDEINNKLNEMVQDGTLQEIITQYLKLNGVLAYNTINDLKQATNIINGSICRTLGFNNYNDGKGSFYKIRTITSNDLIDNINIIPLNISETLIAEKINQKNFYIMPEFFGAKGDGVTDDTEAFKKFFNDDTPNKILGFNKTYILTFTTITKSNFNLIGNFSTLKLKNNLTNNTLLYIDSWTTNIENINIKDVIFDGNKENVTYSDTPIIRLAGHNKHYVKNITIDNCIIKNSSAHGIGNYNNDNTTSNLFQITIKNTKIFNCDGVGIQQSKVESTIENCEIYSTGAENITLDNGCNNCKVINSNLSLYGHGGSIGLDESTNIIITNNIIDGLNNTAVEDYKNAISLNSRTGICENIVVSNNIIKNNSNGISIGTPATLATSPTIVKNLNISNNTIIQNKVGILAKYSSNDTNVSLYNNYYSSNSEVNFKTLANMNIILTRYSIDTGIDLNLTPTNGFTIISNSSRIKNRINYINVAIKIPTISNSGFITLATVPFGNLKTMKAPLYNTDYTFYTLRDLFISNGEIKAYLNPQDSSKILLLNITVQ